MNDSEIYNERISKSLAMALSGSTDGECLAGIQAMRRIMQADGLTPSDAKVFFASGQPGHWMSGVLRGVAYAEKQRDEATAAMQRYRKRLAELETAFLAIKRLFRPIGPRNPNDFGLEHAVRMTKTPIDEVNPEKLFGVL